MHEAETQRPLTEDRQAVRATPTEHMPLLQDDTANGGGEQDDNEVHPPNNEVGMGNKPNKRKKHLIGSKF